MNTRLFVETDPDELDADINCFIKAKKVFSEFGRDFKNEFEIPRYDCLKSKDFNEAMKFTKNWYPSFVLQREIQNINAQTRLDFEDRG